MRELHELVWLNKGRTAIATNARAYVMATDVSGDLLLYGGDGKWSWRQGKLIGIGIGIGIGWGAVAASLRRGDWSGDEHSGAPPQLVWAGNAKTAPRS